MTRWSGDMWIRPKKKNYVRAYACKQNRCKHLRPGRRNMLGSGSQGSICLYVNKLLREIDKCPINIKTEMNKENEVVVEQEKASCIDFSVNNNIGEKILRHDFERVVVPAIRFLKENFHPHTILIIASDRAEISEGLMSYVDIENVGLPDESIQP